MHMYPALLIPTDSDIEYLTEERLVLGE